MDAPMLIQCHSCRAKYRLNLEKIPNRKTFIKCRQCGTPIYIDPQSEGGEEQAPQGPAAPATVQLACDNCGARYQVAAAPLKKVGLKLKCSACGHKFPVPEIYTGAGAAAPGPPAPEEAAEAPPGGNGGEAAGHLSAGAEEAGEKAMPLPGDARMATMFDDLQPEAPLGEGETRHFTPADGLERFAPGSLAETREPDPEAAFQDAISLGEPGGGETGPIQPRGKIPDDQKYRFFMKPKDPNNPEEEGSAAQGEDLVHPDELPPLDEPVGAAPPPPLDEPDGAAPPLDDPAGAAPPPPLDEPPPLGTEAPADGAPPGEPLTLDEQAALILRASQPHGPNQPVENQIIPEKINRRIYVSGLLIALVVLGLSGAWGYWLFAKPTAKEDFLIVPGQVADLTATLTRKGYFVTNQPSGQRLYVLTGEVKNNFPTADGVGWVRVEGTAYDGANKPLRKAHSFAGNILGDEQLKNMGLAEIRAFHAYSNGRDDVNFHIPRGKVTPFQIVLPGITASVVREKAEVKSFTRRGRGVYLKLFP